MSQVTIDSLPFEVLFMVMSVMPVRDRVRASRTNRKFNQAVNTSLSHEKEIPVDIHPIPDASLIPFISKLSNLQVFDFDHLSSGALSLLRAEKLAQTCRRIKSFKSVHTSHLSLVSQYVQALRMPASEVPIQSIELQVQDWQVQTPDLYQHLHDIVRECSQLHGLRVENESYGLMHPNPVWELIGSRITSLEIACPYVSVMDVFRAGDSLQRVASSFTQSDFQYLCTHCPMLQVLEETTFFRESLPHHQTVLSLQSDPNSDSDLILDMQPLMHLKHIHSLTLTSLISPDSLAQVKRFLKERGGLLRTLDLNLSQASEDFVEAVFRYCPSLKRLVLFFSCKSGGKTVSELTEMVHKYSGPSATNVVLLFSHQSHLIQ
jgi:hypothetical protein